MPHPCPILTHQPEDLICPLTKAPATSGPSALWLVGLLALALLWPMSSVADQAQYFYDELGRLSAVVDGTGDTAYYQYDAVGNLLAIVRGTETAPPTITNATPGTVEVGTSVTITITGTHLQGAIVTMANSEVLLSPVPGESETTVSVDLTVPRVTSTGATSLIVTTPFGNASTSVIIQDIVTTVIGTVVDDAGTPLGGAQVAILGGPSGVTAADGSFQFPNLSAYQFDPIQVTATVLVNGEGLYAATPFVAPVLNGVTDIGMLTVSSPQFEHQFGQAIPFDLNQLLSKFVPFMQGFSFPFYGQTYPGVYVTPGGRLTFEFPDAELSNSETAFDEQAGIAAFWTFLSFSDGGEIFVKQLPDRFVVTWFQIPGFGFTDFSTFQATLYIGGRIVLSYGDVAAEKGIVGITPGQSLGEFDLSAVTPLSTTGPVSIYENFAFQAADTFDLPRQLMSFTPNANEGFDVELSSRPEEFTTVIGTVIEEGGSPVNGATVSIVDGPSGLTASDGTFSLANVSIYMPQILRVVISANMAGQPLVVMPPPTLPMANATTDLGTLTLTPYFFEPDFGERLSLGDNDRGFADLGHFSFPFSGINFNGIRIHSNGRLNFFNRPTTVEETLAEFTASPQLAPFFDNLNPGGIGEVFVHQFPNRLVVTWSQVPEFAAIGSNTFQATLFPDGRILFAYAGMTADDAIVGISGSSPTFTESDLSQDLPLSTTGPVTIYEEFDGPLPADGEMVGTDPFDLDHTMILFVPNANGGYDVSQMSLVKLTTTVVGMVVDANSAPVSGVSVATKTGQTSLTAADGTFTLASISTSTGNIQVSATDFSGGTPLYGVSTAVIPIPMGITDVGTVTVAGTRFISELGEPLHQGNDDFDLVPFTQGFTFPFFGATYTQFYVNSNGRITFLAGDTAWAETVAKLDEQPQIAPFFDDWRPEYRFAHAAAEEAIYVNQFPNFIVVTWPRVTEAPLFNTGANTFQVTLFSDGRILFSYQDITSDDGIVGISPGNSATLMESNFSTQAPFSTSGPVAIYEEFKGPLPDDFGEPVGNDPFDLDKKFITFIPNTNGGYDVDVTPSSIEAGTTTVVGTVVDGGGVPVSGAQVHVVGGPTEITASDGTFALASVPFTSLASMQVETTSMQNGQQVAGRSAMVPPVPSGVTDVGLSVLGRKFRALGALNFPPQTAFVNIIDKTVAFDTTQIRRPQDVAVTSDGQLGLVVDSFSSKNTLDHHVLYDLATDPPTFLAAMPTDTFVNSSVAVISPDNRFAVISGKAGTNDVVVLNLEQQAVASEVFDLPGNQAAAITPDGSLLLVLNRAPREVAVLTLDSNGKATDTGKRIALPGFDEGQILITPNGKRALINDYTRHAVDILAIENGVVSYVDTIADIGIGDFGVTDMAITPDGKKVYVNNYFDSALYVLAIDANDVVTKTDTKIVVPAGLFGVDFLSSHGMGFTFDGRTLMLVGSDRSVLSFVDTVTDKVLPEVILYPLGSYPTGIATYVAPF